MFDKVLFIQKWLFDIFYRKTDNNRKYDSTLRLNPYTQHSLNMFWRAQFFSKTKKKTKKPKKSVSAHFENYEMINWFRNTEYDYEKIPWKQTIQIYTLFCKTNTDCFDHEILRFHEHVWLH